MIEIDNSKLMILSFSVLTNGRLGIKSYGSFCREIPGKKRGVIERLPLCDIYGNIMKYEHTIKGKHIDRPNRFIAHVQIGDEVHTVHVKNTGRCKELLLPDSEVILEDCLSDSRKTRYDLIAVRKENLGWVNIDSQAPNKVVKEWLEKDNEVFGHLDMIKPEYSYGDSRVDFYLEKDDRQILMEVKGCTLENDGEGFFPDAPTERGVKHLNELAAAVSKGYECYIAFVIAMNGIEVVHPNAATHPEFGEALQRAVTAGVKILYLCCNVKPDELIIEKAIEGRM